MDQSQAEHQEMFEIPGALLRASRSWAQLMGLDPSKLRPATTDYHGPGRFKEGLEDDH